MRKPAIVLEPASNGRGGPENSICTVLARVTTCHPATRSSLLVPSVHFHDFPSNYRVKHVCTFENETAAVPEKNAELINLYKLLICTVKSATIMARNEKK